MSWLRNAIILEIADRKGSLLLLGIAGMIDMGGRAAILGRLPAGMVGSGATVGSGVACFSSLPNPEPLHQELWLSSTSFCCLHADEAAGYKTLQAGLSIGMHTVVNKKSSADHDAVRRRTSEEAFSNSTAWAAPTLYNDSRSCNVQIKLSKVFEKLFVRQSAPVSRAADAVATNMTIATARRVIFCVAMFDSTDLT